MRKIDYLFSIQEEYNKNRKLKKICQVSLKQKYGNKVSTDIWDRLTKELKMTEENQFSSYYLEMYDYIKQNDLKPWNMSFEGTTGSSLICYLCGITDINPMDSEIPLYPEFFMGYQGNKVPCFNLLLDSNSKEVRMIEKLVEATSKYPTVEEISVIEQMNVFDKYLDLLPISEVDSFKEVLERMKPKTLKELVKVVGLTYSDISSDKVSCREDIYEAAIECGIDYKTAFCIAEYTRRGKGLKTEWQTLLLRKGFSKDILKVCNETKYLCTRAQALEIALCNLRFLYYRINYPNEFNQICGG